METQLETRSETASQVVNQSWLKAIDDLESWMMSQPDCVWEAPQLIHRFSPGVYIREIFMPAGMLIVGAQHKTEHFNVVLTGKARVFMDGRVHDIAAPATIKSGVDVRKVLLILEDMTWQTIHANPDDETDIDVLENRLATFSERYLQKKAERQALLQYTKQGNN